MTAYFKLSVNGKTIATKGGIEFIPSVGDILLFDDVPYKVVQKIFCMNGLCNTCYIFVTKVTSNDYCLSDYIN